MKFYGACNIEAMILLMRISFENFNSTRHNASLSALEKRKDTALYTLNDFIITCVMH